MKNYLEWILNPSTYSLKLNKEYNMSEKIIKKIKNLMELAHDNPVIIFDEGI